MWNAICDLSEYMEYIRQTGDIENMKRMRIEKRYDVRKKRGSKGDGGSQKSIAEMGRNIESMFFRHFPSRDSLVFSISIPFSPQSQSESRSEDGLSTTETVTDVIFSFSSSTDDDTFSDIIVESCNPFFFFKKGIPSDLT